MPFEIPESVRVRIPVEECANCHSPTEVADLVGGVCADCRDAARRVVETAAPTPEETFQPPTLDLRPVDDLEARRARRRAVRDGAVANPSGWVQHAVEAVREECVRARTGHEFTVDTILDTMERRQAPLPATTDHQAAAALRYVMDEAVKRGWCESTGRTMPSRREDTQGKQLRVYRSLL